MVLLRLVLVAMVARVAVLASAVVVALGIWLLAKAGRERSPADLAFDDYALPPLVRRDEPLRPSMPKIRESVASASPILYAPLSLTPDAPAAAVGDWYGAAGFTPTERWHVEHALEAHRSRALGLFRGGLAHQALRAELQREHEEVVAYLRANLPADKFAAWEQHAWEGISAMARSETHDRDAAPPPDPPAR